MACNGNVTIADLTHGEPEEVAAMIDGMELGEAELRAVLINLLNRIARLEMENDIARRKEVNEEKKNRSAGHRG